MDEVRGKKVGGVRDELDAHQEDVGIFLFRAADPKRGGGCQLGETGLVWENRREETNKSLRVLVRSGDEVLPVYLRCGERESEAEDQNSR